MTDHLKPKLTRADGSPFTGTLVTWGKDRVSQVQYQSPQYRLTDSGKPEIVPPPAPYYDPHPTSFVMSKQMAAMFRRAGWKPA